MDSREQLESTVTGLRDSLARWDEAPSGPDDDGRTSFDGMIEDDALDVYATAEVRWDQSDMRSVTVVFGTGGPHVQATCTLSGDGSFRAEGWWGSDHAVRHGRSDTFETWCTDWADGLRFGE